MQVGDSGRTELQLAVAATAYDSPEQPINQVELFDPIIVAFLRWRPKAFCP